MGFTQNIEKIWTLPSGKTNRFCLIFYPWNTPHQTCHDRFKSVRVWSEVCLTVKSSHIKRVLCRKLQQYGLKSGNMNHSEE